MAQRLNKAFAPLTQDPGSVPSIHMAAHNQGTGVTGDLTPVFGLCGM